MLSKHMKRYLTLLVTIEVQNKTTIRCHYIPFRNIETPNVDYDAEQLELILQMGGKTGTATLENGWHYHIKLNICTKRQQYS